MCLYIDAAEMDFVDDYIRALVDISFLEDSEERARTEFDHLRKRWEARVSNHVVYKDLYNTPHTNTQNLIHNLDI